MVVVVGTLMCALAVFPLDTANASTDTLRLGVTYTTDSSGYSVAVVTASGNTSSDPFGFGWELDVFQAPAGSSCTSTALSEDLALGLPGPTETDYEVSGTFSHTFRLDPQKTSATSYVLCGYLSYLNEAGETDASATAIVTLAPKLDKLAFFGASHKRPMYFPLYTFSTLCTSAPCRITLSEQTFVRGRHVSKLDAKPTGPIVERTTPKRGIFAVWFQQKDFEEKSLTSAISKYGSASVHVNAVMKDSLGRVVSGYRTITLLPRLEPKPTKPTAPSKPLTPAQKETQRVEAAVDAAVGRYIDAPAGQQFSTCHALRPGYYDCTVTAYDEESSEYRGGAHASVDPGGIDVVIDYLHCYIANGPGETCKYVKD